MKYRLYLDQRSRCLPGTMNADIRAGQVVVVACDVGLNSNGDDKSADGIVAEVVAHKRVAQATPALVV